MRDRAREENRDRTHARDQGESEEKGRSAREERTGAVDGALCDSARKLEDQGLEHDGRGGAIADATRQAV